MNKCSSNCCCSPKKNHSSCCCQGRSGNTTRLYEEQASKNLSRRDSWKFHICEPACVDCYQLLHACVNFDAKEACIMFNKRCYNNIDTKENKRKQNNICESGCLDCFAMRYGCESSGDLMQCRVYKKFCSVNEDENEKGFMTHGSTVMSRETATELVNNLNARNILQLYPTPTVATARNCSDHLEKCETRNLIYIYDCIEWALFCTKGGRK